jgi:hypothetical protein
MVISCGFMEVLCDCLHGSCEVVYVTLCQHVACVAAYCNRGCARHGVVVCDVLRHMLHRSLVSAMPYSGPANTVCAMLCQHPRTHTCMHVCYKCCGCCGGVLLVLQEAHASCIAFSVTQVVVLPRSSREVCPSGPNASPQGTVYLKWVCSSCKYLLLLSCRCGSTS